MNNIRGLTARKMASLCCLLGLSMFYPVFAEDTRSFDATVIRFGITSSVLESDVNPDDALVAAKLWAATLGTTSGIWTKSEARIYRDTPSLVAAVKSGETDVVAISTEEFLQVESELRAEPALTYIQSGQAELEYVVVTHKESEAKSIADLRGKRIVIPRGGRTTMVPLWLDALLYDSNLPLKEVYFKEIKEVAKTSQVVLPVFFQQMDAGIVTKSGFETAVALNPQIDQHLRIIAKSPRIVALVTCLRSGLPTERKTLYVDQALKLHETPGGLQKFNVFKLERLVRWEPRYADAVRELMKKQKLAKSVHRASGRISVAMKEER
jgi:ABC-type phosphate/phosphonate transport system substrate-binding protein